MLQKTIPVNNGAVEAFLIPLAAKNLIVLRGSKGFIICGYLDLTVAEKFGDIACRITGVSSIEEALQAPVQSCTSAASELGISPGMPVKEALKVIA
jgi:uncharacterized protein YunC (DUF1805 family)